ncbi:MAG TPA: glycosyltransferase family 2 protein [Saprospiraceae bacterium]|nr:glycosyltransferase family 2 protein [Saprospiraceae bacterium]
MPSSNQYSLSVVMMTFNEEANIERCLKSVEGVGDEILVLDSFSTDRTVEIARSMGARVEQFPFDSYVNQKARMIQMADSNWVLSIDADEYLSEELKASILNARVDKKYDGYTSNRRNKIGSKWLNHGSWYPDKKIRLFDRRKVFITGKDPHDIMQPIADARIGHLQGDLMHLSDEDISSRYRSVNQHSIRAAQALFEQKKAWSLWRMLFKPWIRFFTSYIIRLGFLDGYYGWIVAKSEGHYVWMREVKLWELWRQGAGNREERMKGARDKGSKG